MSDKELKRAVIALGYFDSVHRGHKKVIEKAKELASSLNAITVVFTFEGNLKAVLGNNQEKVVFTPLERQKFIKDLGADEIFFAPTNKDFLSMEKGDFLRLLNKSYNVLSYVSGQDYRFGKFGEGTVDDIEHYALNHGQTAHVVNTLCVNGKRVSTTAIKGLLSAGDVENANLLLGRKYSITGKVVEGRKVGGKIGFPTVNVSIDKDKHRLKDGVYQGEVDIDGKTYVAVINYGARPTFNLDEKLIEAHVIDFNGVIYGKTLTLRFSRFMRDIIKFNNCDELKEQLIKDVKRVKGDI